MPGTSHSGNSGSRKNQEVEPSSRWTHRVPYSCGCDENLLWYRWGFEPAEAKVLGFSSKCCKLCTPPSGLGHYRTADVDWTEPHGRYNVVERGTFRRRIQRFIGPRPARWREIHVVSFRRCSTQIFCTFLPTWALSSHLDGIRQFRSSKVIPFLSQSNVVYVIACVIFMDKNPLNTFPSWFRLWG